MNTYLFIAGILCLVLGLVHSALGEYMIFSTKRNQGALVPAKVSKDLKARHLRIIWASWHVCSVFGWCIGAFLLKISFLASESDSEFISFLLVSTIVAMGASGFLVLIATRGRHPGWIVLLAIATLVIMGL